MQHGKLRTDRGSWFINQACFLQHPWHLPVRKLIIPRLPQARLPHHPWHLQLCQAKVWPDKNRETRVGWISIPQLCQVKVWKGKNGESRTLSETSEEFLNKPTRIPKSNQNENHEQVRGDPCREVFFSKHSVYTHFPKDRNCEICQRIQITGPRAEDVLAEAYLVQKILVVWLQQITKFSVKEMNLDPITYTHSWYNI